MRLVFARCGIHYAIIFTYLLFPLIRKGLLLISLPARKSGLFMAIAGTKHAERPSVPSFSDFCIQLAWFWLGRHENIK
jgi:hypothetical protein